MWSRSCQKSRECFFLLKPAWFSPRCYCLAFLVLAVLSGCGGGCIYKAQGRLAEVAGHTVRGRQAFEERWVQKRGGCMSELSASFSEHRWAHGIPANSSMGVLKQVWAISPPCAVCVFRLFQSDGSAFESDESHQSEQRIPLFSGSEQVLIPLLVCVCVCMGGAMLGSAFLLIKFLLSLLYLGDLFLWDE